MRTGGNGRVVVLLSTVVVAMVGLSFAAVPLYRLFCQVTGYGGTTQVAEAPSAEAGERIVKVRFNADVDASLPWSFVPAQIEVALHVGEVGMAFYEARNPTDRAITGTAVFNVTPLKAGQYFNKVQCFCFDEQRLEAGQSVDMPVTFFVDPAIDDDPNLDDVRTITLSYTFFRAEESEADEGEDVSSNSNHTRGRAVPAVAQQASLR
jgi:cytochrome c oxidase assembly protein subunit 11